MSEKQKNLFVVSLGCVKNRVDTEVMLGVAQKAGFQYVSEPESAHVIVVNTCGFIDDAKRESIDVILEMAAHKKKNVCETLVVAGCLAQRYPQELARDLTEVDHFLGSSDALSLGRVLAGEAERMLVGNPADWVVRASNPRVLTTGSASAYVKIAEGCNRKCSFCVIPTLRGKQRSRPLDDVVREVQQLASQGVREVNLISQDTVAYGRDLAGPRGGQDGPGARPELADLVRRVADIRGIEWVRLLYLYPEVLSEPLVELLGQHPPVLPYLDMPLQHASDRMLRLMRRGHGGARLRTLVERLRRDIPGLVMRTAFIVGHPGETEEDFEELCDFVRWARFDRLVAFCYSDEEGTGSYQQADKVPAKVAKARYRKLMTLQKRISLAHHQALMGSEVDVLVEGASEDHEHVLVGRHAGQAPDIDGHVYLSGGEAEPGTMRRVKLTQATHYDLVGELLEPPCPAPTPQAPRKPKGPRVLPVVS